MATIDWPEALIPQTAQLSLRKSGTQFVSPFNGTLQALDFIAERWTLSASLAQMSARNPRGVDVFCNQLAGGVERVRVWPFHSGGVPRGTFRGAPTLSAAALRGNTSISIQGAGSLANLLRGSSFEVDSNADGVADNWLTYSAGGSGTVSYSRVPGFRGAWAQRVDSTSLGPGDGDRIGVRYAFDIPVQPGQPYTLSARMRASTSELVVNVDWRDAANAFISPMAFELPSSTGWQRLAASGVAPALAAFARVFVWVQDVGTVAAPAWVEIDDVQFEPNSVATEYAFLPTLRQGDFIGAGGQLFMVAEDRLLSDLGAGVVPVVNRVRSTIAAGSPVTWYRPTCEMVLPAMQAGPVRRPGVIESTALDLVEVW